MLARASRFIVFLFLTGSHLLVAASASGNTNTSQSNCQLVYGWANWPPLQYTDSQGEITGVQIDLVRALAKETHCKIIYIERNWSEIVDLIESGEIDFTANATLSERRKQFAYFSRSYRRDSYAVWVRSEDLNQYNFSSVDTLKKSGVKIGLTANHLYSEAIDQWIQDPRYSKNISYAPSSSINMQRLINGEIDASLEDPFIVAYKRRTKQITADISRLPIQIFGHKVSFMFSKKTVDKNFVEQFNLALKRLQESPDFSSIWLDPQFIDD